MNYQLQANMKIILLHSDTAQSAVCVTITSGMFLELNSDLRS